MAESLPTSVSAFAPRRSRADSVTSFAFYREEPDESPFLEDEDEDGHPGEFGDHRFSQDVDDEDWPDLERQSSDNDFVLHRRASTTSRGGSVHSRLLRRDSLMSAGSGFGTGRTNQKVYMINEDLYVVIAGFRTSPFGLTLYVLACAFTLGLGWLIFRWLPRWHVKLVGQPAPLRECEWVVIEVSGNGLEDGSAGKL